MSCSGNDGLFNAVDSHLYSQDSHKKCKIHSSCGDDEAPVLWHVLHLMEMKCASFMLEIKVARIYCQGASSIMHYKQGFIRDWAMIMMSYRYMYSALLDFQYLCNAIMSHCSISQVQRILLNPGWALCSLTLSYLLHKTSALWFLCILLHQSSPILHSILCSLIMMNSAIWCSNVIL